MGIKLPREFDRSPASFIFGLEGILVYWDVGVLRECLKKSPDLESIRISLFPQPRLYTVEQLRRRGPPTGRHSYFMDARHLFDVKGFESRTALGQLTSLTLENVRLDQQQEGLFEALNISNLRTLRPKDCPQQLPFLDAIYMKKIPMRLTCLELVENSFSARSYDENDKSGLRFIVDFIGSCRGLQDLCFVVPSS